MQSKLTTGDFFFTSLIATLSLTSPTFLTNFSFFNDTILSVSQSSISSSLPILPSTLTLSLQPTGKLLDVTRVVEKKSTNENNQTMKKNQKNDWLKVSSIFCDHRSNFVICHFFQYGEKQGVTRAGG